MRPIKSRLSVKRIAFAAVGLLVLPVLSESCIQQFTPPEIGYNDQYLVVDGFFNAGGMDTSRIELRRTQNINQQDQPLIEPGATVTAENEAGRTYPFTESSKGLYVLPPTPYDLRSKYRI